MYFTGTIWKQGKQWLIEVPNLDFITQGKSRKHAFEMLIDGLSLLVNDKKFKFTISFSKRDNEFFLKSNDDKKLISLALKRQRIKNNLTLSDLAKKLKAKSKNAYAQYEQGRNLPSLTKIQDFLNAMNSNIKLVFTIVES
jgi:DNA-binding XRE family transcriptional regulator